MAVTYTLDHVHLNAPDVESTSAFYERVFGMRRIRTFEALGMTYVQLDAGGARVTITSREPKATGRGNAVDHFALYVDDLQEAIADLCAKGVEFQAGPLKAHVFDVVFVQAPDGVAVEVMAPSSE